LLVVMYPFDKSSRKSPKNYIRQSLLAMLVVAIILIFLRLLHGFVVTAAVGIMANGWSFQTALIVLIAALGLTIARRFLRPHLKDLF